MTGCTSPEAVVIVPSTAAPPIEMLRSGSRPGLAAVCCMVGRLGFRSVIVSSIRAPSRA
ncbi:hypothetical protein D3C72_2328020 [compost metagenome]